MDEGPRFREVVPAQEASDVQALIARMRHLVLARDKGAAVHKRDRDLRQRDIVPPERLAACRTTVVGVGAIGRQVAVQLLCG